MGKAFDIQPRQVGTVDTPYRRIVTPIPAPASLQTLETLRRYEPVSMTGQPPIVWDRAEGFQVYDGCGNKWLDFSSGVLVANAGHGAPEIRDAIIRQAQKGLLHNYCFPSAERAQLVQYLVSIAPPPLSKVILLTTGAEAVENVVKLARTYGQHVGGRSKIGIVSFERSFHGRTLGAQMVGGIPSLKDWIVHLDPAMVQVPFPDGFRTEDTSFDLFLRTLDSCGVGPDQIAGVLSETFQGSGASFAPVAYMRALAEWCRAHNILLIFDEVQAGFGRSGKLFAFEHYDIVPDLVCCGKGITSSLPLSAVLGRADIMDLYGPAEMTSTHIGNPVCVAAALASVHKIVEGCLIQNAQRMGDVLFAGLEILRQRQPGVIGAIHGRGLVAGVHLVRAGSTEPDGDLAFQVVQRAVEKGLLLFAPVGVGGATVKIAPPLIITADALQDGLVALGEALDEAVAQRAS